MLMFGRKFFYLILITLLPVGVAADDLTPLRFKEGVQYKKLSKPSLMPSSDGKVEVIEFFSYACRHCFALEPVLERWNKTKADYIQFKRVPAFWNAPFTMMAKAYYVAEGLGVSHKVHQALFSALHLEQRQLFTEERLKAFFNEQGVDAKQFEQVYNSYSIKQNMKKADNLFRKYQLRGVPAMIVGERYFTDVNMAGGHEQLTELLSYLAQSIKQSS